ncbi:MAG: 50S ribosomal protein L4, partial [Chloroflexota bacterium]|nr:50S ribosomal protein L4 [Chloroflexota bacterium]
MEGAVVGSVDLDDTVWGIEPNIGVMHQALVRQQANARVGTAETKTRAQVRGGGRKPWRQKGTGRARQGSTRAPNWVGGGVVWGPHMRSYDQDMPKKMRGLAVRSALSAKLRDERVVIVDGLDAIEPKTRAMKDVVAKLPESRSFLLVMPEKIDSVVRASGNLENVHWVL